MTLEQLLSKFYGELNAWIEGGCAQHPVFDPEKDLLESLLRWYQHWHQHHKRHQPHTKLIATLLVQSFFKARLDPINPFGDTILGHSRYVSPVAGAVLYSNPARLTWIKEHMGV